MITVAILTMVVISWVLMAIGYRNAGLILVTVALLASVVLP